MNYQLHYQRLIARAVDRLIPGYFERHHITPKCLGGDDNPANLANLTPEEHYVAHQLLVKIHRGHAGLIYAALKMAKQCTGRRAYGWLRRRYSAAKIGVKLPPRTKEHCQKLANAKRGVPRGPISEKHKNALVASNLGRRRSEETRRRISNAQSGRPLAPAHRENVVRMLKDRAVDPIWRRKVSEGKKGKPLSDKHRANVSSAMKIVWAKRKEQRLV